MINKFLKRIHSNFKTFFKFIFFLRYLLAIFVVSLGVFVAIPYFFDYEKRAKTLKEFLFNNYGFKLKDYETIKFNFFPLPNLNIQSASLNIGSGNSQLKITSLKIYPKFLNIYNYENFNASKIILEKNKAFFDISELKYLKGIFSLEKKLKLTNLDLSVSKLNEPLINLKNISFSNFGYNKNIIKGDVFDTKFKTEIDNKHNIKFNLLNTGVIVDLFFNENRNNQLSGYVRSKVLNAKTKFDFELSNEEFKILNLKFLSRNLSFKNISTIRYKPFFLIETNFEVNKFDSDLIKKINLDKILEYKNFIKKINSKNKVNFDKKKFDRGLIKNLNLNFDLAYGKIFFVNSFSISDGLVNCKGDINLLDDYPNLFFDCSLTTKEIKKLFKQFSIKKDYQNQDLNIKVIGNINIFNKRISFNTIKINDEYTATESDLKYFKNSFEDLLFDKNFINIFNYEKIKNFLIEIS